MMLLMERRDGEVIKQACQPRFEAEYDVIVVGLGTAGAIAAIRSAQLGLRVLGIERSHGMGGAGTFGGVVGYYFGSRGGICEEIDKKADKLASDSFLPLVWGMNANAKSVVLEQEAADAGVDIVYESQLLGVYMEKRSVRGLRWISPEGIRHTAARVVIDATGEAEVCAMAACEVRRGRETDGQVQPFSNVLQWIENDRVLQFYTDSGYVDASDPEAMSKAIVDSALVHTHLQPAYGEDKRLMKLMPQLGLREGRLIVGEETVRFSDFSHGRFSKEPLFFAYSNLDNHSKDVAFESEGQCDWSVAASLWGLNFTVPVPAGALIPKHTDGLLVAGRSISLDHDLAGCIRMKRDMQKCGEAAANLAYLSIKQQVRLVEVPYAELRPMLEETGCLERGASVEFKDSSIQAKGDFIKSKWMKDIGRIREGLSGEKPGIAIWSAYLAGESQIASLEAWASSSEEKHLARHSAIALGLLGAASAMPVLREMVAERDMFVPSTSRKYNQVRGCAAIYLLGKMGDQEIVAELLRIMEDPSELPEMDSVTLERNREFIADREELYFQYFSHALQALLRIGERHRTLRPTIAAAIRTRMQAHDFDQRISFKGASTIKYSVAGRIRKIVADQMSTWQIDA